MSTELGIVIYAGGPCCCRPGRYVRYIIPRGVPGATAAIHCRDAEAVTEGKATHPIPRGAVLMVRTPSVDGSGR